MFPGSFVSHLTKRRSDHLPIILHIKKSATGGTRRRINRIYRFEEMWLRDDACAEVIKKAWEGDRDVRGKLSRTAGALTMWSKIKFRNFAREMRECTVQMENLMANSQTEETIAKMREIDERMDELERREELYWRQRSRQDWLQCGDKNTDVFHTKAKQRVQRNTISIIHDEAGQKFEEEDQIQEVFAAYYENLLSAGGQVETSDVVNKIIEKVRSEDVNMLAATYTGAEVKDALDQMHPTKAPGPDGMSAIFYQAFWPTVGGDVVERVLGILNRGEEIESINNTHVVLIPTKKKCESPMDYRPISLCNVIYKVVSKVVANRLKKVLPYVIHES